MLKLSETERTRREPSRTVKTAALHDKQSERDHRELRIDKVGVTPT